MVVPCPCCKGSSPERTHSRDSATLHARPFTVSPTCYWLTGLPGRRPHGRHADLPAGTRCATETPATAAQASPDSSKATRPRRLGDPKPRRHTQQDGVRLSRARRIRRPSERRRIFTSRSLVFFRPRSNRSGPQLPGAHPRGGSVCPAPSPLSPKQAARGQEKVGMEVKCGRGPGIMGRSV